MILVLRVQNFQNTIALSSFVFINFNAAATSYMIDALNKSVVIGNLIPIPVGSPWDHSHLQAVSIAASDAAINILLSVVFTESSIMFGQSSNILHGFPQI